MSIEGESCHPHAVGTAYVSASAVWNPYRFTLCQDK